MKKETRGWGDAGTRGNGDAESFELLVQHGVNKRRDAGTRGRGDTEKITNYELRIMNYKLREALLVQLSWHN